MILRIAIGVLVVMLQACRGHAIGIDRGPIPFERGQIVDFYKNPYLQDDRFIDRMGWAVIIEQRIWNGDEWLPLASHRGAAFLRQYEQEVRDGAVDSE